jgi:hypothetical protein
MTENEVADMVMEVLGMDRSEPRITEVEAGDGMTDVEIEVDTGQRFLLTVTEKK